jgi:hypothetical protein
MFIEENPRTLKEGEMSDAETIKRLRAVNAKLLAALEGLLENHCSLVSSGDCGFWNVEEESEVIQARAAIEEARK